MRTLLIAGLLFFFCSSIVFSQNTITRKEWNAMANSQNIKGKWYLNKWTLYHTLNFSDKTVYVDNHVDTVFTVPYSVTGDSIIIWAGQNPLPFKNKIITLTKDTLVLQGILDAKEIRRYSRKKIK